MNIPTIEKIMAIELQGVEVKENFIFVPVRDKSDFQEGTYATITLSKKKGILAAIATLKNSKKRTIQRLLFDKDKWSREDAIKEAHKIKSRQKNSQGEVSIMLNEDIEFQGELGEIQEITSDIANQYGIDLSEINKTNLKLIEGVLMFTDEICQPTKLGKWDGNIDTFVFDAEKAKNCISTLKNKPIHAKVDLDGHFDVDESGNKIFTPIGVFLGSRIVDSEVRILGGLWEEDFPNLISDISASKADLGMSFELKIDEVLDVIEDSGIAVIGNHTHKGGCILWKDSAAFRDTQLLVAQKGGGDNIVDDDVLMAYDDIDPYTDCVFDELNLLEGAKITRASMNDLPDAAFAIILPGGKKDESGKTVPRSLRKLPHHTGGVKDPSDDTIDKAHLRNALARVEQPNTDLTPAQRAKARAHLMRHAKALGIGDSKNSEGKGGSISVDVKTFTQNEVDKIVKDAIAEFQAKLDEGKVLAAKDTEIDKLKVDLQAKTAENDTLKKEKADLEKTTMEKTAELAATEWFNTNAKFYPADKKAEIIAARKSIEMGEASKDEIEKLVSLKNTRGLVIGSGGGNGGVDKEDLAKRHGLQLNRIKIT